MRLVVLGDPVAHSRSPAIQQAAFDHSGIAAVYAARRVDRAGLAAAVAAIRAGRLDGANVTMPHKQEAAALADRRSPETARAGAANTLLRRGGAVHAHLTDVEGIRAAWERARLAASGPVLVLGAGGAAAAALLALEGREIAVSARRPDAAARLIALVGVEAATVPWEQGRDGAVVVNATPLGMAGEDLPRGVVAGCSGLFEMAYGAGDTPATRAVAAAGRPVASGRDMLVAQAAASFELWTGRKAPIAVMAAAF